MANKVPEFVVKVVEYASEKVVKTSKPMSERKANVVERGMNRNLNHEDFFTVTEPVASA